MQEKSNVFLPESQAKCLVMSFIVFCVLANGQSASSQEPVETGKEILVKRNFPWFDSENETVADFSQENRRRAKSLNRHDLSIRTQNRSSFNFGSGWMSLFGTATWIIIGIIFLLIAGIFVWVFLQMEDRTNSNSYSEEREEEAMQQRIKQLPFQLEQGFNGNFRELAAAASQQGDSGRAAMLLFSHVLLTLDRNKLIRLRKGKTNRQYLGELKPYQPIAKYFQRVMVPFEDSFFGRHLIEKTAFEACWQGLDEFEIQVRNSAEAVTT